MQEQFKYRYFIDGKEIDTREEYFNTTMSGDYVSYFDGDSVFSVSFNSFFGGQKEKQIEQRLKLAEYYKEKAIKEYELDTPLTKASRGLNDHVKEIIENGSFIYEVKDDNNFTFDTTKPPTEMYITDILGLGQIKGNSTRHKSQNGETHTKTCIEIIKEKQDKYYPFLRVNFQVGENGSEGCKVYTNFHTINEVKEYMKDTDYTHYFVYDINGKKISWGSVNKDSKNNQISAEQNKTEENLVFKKDSEIHKEELKPDFSFTSTPKEINDAVNDARSEGVNEGVKRNNEGVKESNGKTDYSEINLEILDIMAERFTANKHKYPQGNMKKPIDIKSLEWALFRHVKKMIQPIETDEETYKDHLSAVLCNCSMILDQLKNQK